MVITFPWYTCSWLSELEPTSELETPAPSELSPAVAKLHLVISESVLQEEGDDEAMQELKGRIAAATAEAMQRIQRGQAARQGWPASSSASEVT